MSDIVNKKKIKQFYKVVGRLKMCSVKQNKTKNKHLGAIWNLIFRAR